MPEADGRWRRTVLRLLVFIGGAALVLPLLLAAVVGFRLLFYRQVDDRAALARKQAYLESIAELPRRDAEAPNFVIILFDDLGYGDVAAVEGAIRTPSLDRLAAEGITFTNGYAPSPYCSASRAGLLTGRYPVRSGLDHVLQAPGTWQDLLLRLGWRNRRLPGEEITLAEVLSAAGYATSLVGKWHLGEGPALPTERGFGSFFGLLYSNDQGRPALWRDRETIEPHPIAQTTLTRRYTEEAVRFVRSHAHDRNAGGERQPFFLYLAHTFPHIPLHVGEERRGRSPAGLYGDVIEELDWSVGEVLAALREAGIAEQTLVFVSSDNGPWFQGSSGGVRGRKFDVFEGGTRVPFLTWWPETIAAGERRDELVSALDLFPTLLEAAGLPMPDDRVLDGSSLLEALTEGAPSPRREVLYFQLQALRALREGRFKYHERHRVFYGNPMNWAWAPARQRGPWLFDLASDPGEAYDVTERHPQVAERLRRRLEQERAALEENRPGWR